MEGKEAHPPDLEHHPQHPHARLIPGWSTPRPEKIPRSTVWPAALAFAIAFLFWGIITSTILSLVGLLLFIIALAGWIGEMRHE